LPDIADEQTLLKIRLPDVNITSNRLLLSNYATWTSSKSCKTRAHFIKIYIILKDASFTLVLERKVLVSTPGCRSGQDTKNEETGASFQRGRV